MQTIQDCLIVSETRFIKNKANKQSVLLYVVQGNSLPLNFIGGTIIYHEMPFITNILNSASSSPGLTFHAC